MNWKSLLYNAFKSLFRAHHWSLLKIMYVAREKSIHFFAVHLIISIWTHLLQFLKHLFSVSPQTTTQPAEQQPWLPPQPPSAWHSAFLEWLFPIPRICPPSWIWTPRSFLSRPKWTLIVSQPCLWHPKGRFLVGLVLLACKLWRRMILFHKFPIPIDWVYFSVGREMWQRQRATMIEIIEKSINETW